MMKTATQTHEDRRAQVRLRYTDAVAMQTYLHADITGETLADLYIRARGALRTARDPRGRFGLTAEETAVVLPVITNVIAQVEVVVLKMRPQLEALRGRGLTWGECWTQFKGDTHGFDEVAASTVCRITGLE